MPHLCHAPCHVGIRQQDGLRLLPQQLVGGACRLKAAVSQSWQDQPPSLAQLYTHDAEIKRANHLMPEQRGSTKLC